MRRGSGAGKPAMAEALRLHYDVAGNDFLHAGEASGSVKTVLRQLGFEPEVIRRLAVAMYEGEINMVIHAGGGTADVTITPACIDVCLTDHGPGIADVTLAMREGYSTAPAAVREMGFGAGMGLPNMKKYSDRLEIDTHPGRGTTVRLTVCTRPQGKRGSL